MEEPLLRVPSDFILDDSFKATMTAILGQKFTLLRYTSEPNLWQSYQTRMKSIHESFQFLCEAYPTVDVTTLQQHLSWSTQEQLDLPAELDCESYQQILTSYTTILVHALIELWGWNQQDKSALQTAIQRLDKAEQYLLLQKPRPPFATLTYLDADKQKLILILDKPLAPFTTKTREDLILIKQREKHPEARAKFQELPEWFTSLDRLDQTLLQHSLQKINLENPEKIILLSSRLRTIPGLANFAEHRLYLIAHNGAIIKTFEPRYRSSHLGSRDVIRCSTETQKTHTETNCLRLTEIIQQDPLQPKRPLLIQTLISPVWAAQTWTPDYYLDQERLHAVNYFQEHQQPIYSSNHPLNYARIISYTAADSPECLAIITAAQAALTETFHQTLSREQKIALPLLISEYQKTLNSANGTAYVFDWNCRELFLSSLEHLIILFINGVSYGSCVSGKDRKAIELIHTNAMLLFYEQEKTWPSYTDTDQRRQNFVALVAKLYQTNHYQLFSGQNAPGSDGIKTPQGYLPTDISHAINTISPPTSPYSSASSSPKSSPPPTLALTLTRDDRLASNNDVEALTCPTYASYLSAAKGLHPRNLQKLISCIQAIVKNQKSWQTRTTSNPLSFLFSMPMEKSRPTGIAQIDAILEQPQPLKLLVCSIKQLADIYTIVAQRSENFSLSRDPLTQSFYTQIKKLYTTASPNAQFNTILMGLEKIKAIVSVDNDEQTASDDEEEEEEEDVIAGFHF